MSRRSIVFARQAIATVMGSNKMGIGSPIPPLSEVASVTVCGCEADWPLHLIGFSIGHEEAVFCVCVTARACGVEYSLKDCGTTS